MKILYISSTYAGMHSKSIYYDLMQEFVTHGHEVYIAYAREKRLNKRTELYKQNNITYLGIKTGNMTKNRNFITKGIATLTIDYYFAKAFKKYFSDLDFDIILFSTPPITFDYALRTLKTQSPNAILYLMLKDIFPQNAIDLDLMSSKSPLTRYFKLKEKKLYDIADVIGVMSPENKKYLEKHNSEVAHKIEILPNTITLVDSNESKSRKDYGIPENKVVLLYGGNLGAPQGIPFLIECLEEIKYNSEIVFVIAGSGGKDYILKNYLNKHENNNVIFLGQLSATDYSHVAKICDIGLIFLDYRFTIPNFPQRLLSYLENEMPVICATDDATDIGKIAEDNGFGYQVKSNDSKEWYKKVNTLAQNSKLRVDMGERGLKYLKQNYTSQRAYRIILAHKEEQDV